MMLFDIQKIFFEKPRLWHDFLMPRFVEIIFERIIAQWDC